MNSNVPTDLSQDIPATAYLFSYFQNNGEDGLHLAWSRDGLKWEALKGDRSFLPPLVGKSKLMRDPSITQGPDGTFHMVWTDSWDSQTIGYASSKDLIHWSEQRALEVMQHEPTVQNCWAPEIAYDEKRGHFLIFWSSTIPGRFPETDFDGKNHGNHRIYATTTKDFQSFTPTTLYFDPGFNCIDASLLRRDGKVYMFFKDENLLPAPGKKNLRLAVANDLAGPYEVLPEEVTPVGRWAEGPASIEIDGAVYVFFDLYMDKTYGVLRSRDLKNWEDISSQLVGPKFRHGTVFRVPGKIVQGLIEAAA